MYSGFSVYYQMKIDIKQGPRGQGKIDMPGIFAKLAIGPSLSASGGLRRGKSHADIFSLKLNVTTFNFIGMFFATLFDNSRRETCNRTGGFADNAQLF